MFFFLLPSKFSSKQKKTTLVTWCNSQMLGSLVGKVALNELLDIQWTETKPMHLKPGFMYVCTNGLHSTCAVFLARPRFLLLALHAQGLVLLVHSSSGWFCLAIQKIHVRNVNILLGVHRNVCSSHYVENINSLFRKVFW